MSTEAGDLGADPGADEFVVVDQEHPGLGGLGHVDRGITSCTSVPSPSAVVDEGLAAELAHPLADRQGDALAVGRDGVEVEAHAPVANEEGDRVRLHLGEDRDALRPADHFAALIAASRPAATSVVDSFVGYAVADRHEVDAHAVVVLHVVLDGAHQAHEGGRGVGDASRG